MDYQAFKQEWLTRRVDFTRDGKYTATDLISEYLWSTQQVKFEATDTSLESLYNYIPDDLTAVLYETQDTVVKQGDICFLEGFQHWGIATGNQDTERFEILEQNVVGSNTGIGDDAIRENYYSKDQLHGVWRMRHAPIVQPLPVVTEEPKPETPPEPKVVLPYRSPKGALKVPLATQRILVKVELDTYPDPAQASRRENPTGKKLRQGMQDFDLLKQGMLRVAGTTTWINPLDNVVQPKPVIRPPQMEYTPDLDGAKEAEANYLDFKDQTGKLTEKYYTAKEGGAFVIDFVTGNTRRMPANAHVWVAGITRVGEMGYAIATKCIELEPPRWVGIRLGDLYEDDTFSKEVPVEDKKALRTLKASDYVVLAKARVQKKFLDIKRKG